MNESAFRNLVKFAAVADSKGDFSTGDAITEFLRLSQALTLNRVLQGVPGMEMSTQNLSGSAEGAYRGYFKGNPQGTFQDSSSAAPENPMISQAQNPLNWVNKSSDEIQQMIYEEKQALRNHPSMQYLNNQSVMQYADFLRRYPNLPEPVRQQIYQSMAGMLLGHLWGQEPQVVRPTLERIYKMWPDMPANLKAHLNAEAQLIMQMQWLNQQMMGLNYMGPYGQSSFKEMPANNLLGYQGAGMTPTPLK
jgi:hypothetical protein